MCFKFYFFFLIIFLSFLFFEHPLLTFGNYSNILYIVSSFDFNILIFIFLFTFYFLLTYVKFFGSVFFLPFFTLLPFISIILTNHLGTFKKLTLNLNNSYSRYVLNFLTVFEGPSYLHGVSFLFIFSFFLVLVVDFTFLKPFSNFFYNFFRILLFLFFFSFYIFISGGFWAFFSSVWGNWYNNDGVELYYLVFFFLIIFFGHNFKFNSKTFFLSFIFFSFFFFICLRFGFLNSKHSNSVLKVFTCFYGGVYFNLFIFTVFLYYTRIKNLYFLKNQFIYYFDNFIFYIFLEFITYSFIFLFTFLISGFLQIQLIFNPFFIFYIFFIFFYFLWFFFLFFNSLKIVSVSLFNIFHVLFYFFIIGWFLYFWCFLTQLHVSFVFFFFKNYNYIFVSKTVFTFTEFNLNGGNYIALLNSKIFYNQKANISIFKYFYCFNFRHNLSDCFLLDKSIQYKRWNVTKLLGKNYILFSEYFNLFSSFVTSTRHSNIQNFFILKFNHLDFIFVKSFIFSFFFFFLCIF